MIDDSKSNVHAKFAAFAFTVELEVYGKEVITMQAPFLLFAHVHVHLKARLVSWACSRVLSGGIFYPGNTTRCLYIITVT